MDRPRAPAYPRPPCRFPLPDPASWAYPLGKEPIESGSASLAKRLGERSKGGRGFCTHLRSIDPHRLGSMSWLLAPVLQKALTLR